MAKGKKNKAAAKDLTDVEKEAKAKEEKEAKAKEEKEAKAKEEKEAKASEEESDEDEAEPTVQMSLAGCNAISRGMSMKKARKLK